MRYSQRQHQEMARRLRERAKKMTDKTRSNKIEQLAMVFEKLADKAAARGVPDNLPETVLIDPPGPFDDLETWVQFLKKIERMPASDLSDDIIQHARGMIARKQSGA